MERRSYRYSESGLPNLVLQGVEVTECDRCETVEVSLPHLSRIHRAVALHLTKSPRRLTGPQFRFLRKHLGLSGDQLAGYLHTDKTKISKWEREEDAIGPSSDRLVRLLVAALDPELTKDVPAVAEHLKEIADTPGRELELHVDVEALTAAFVGVDRAA